MCSDVVFQDLICTCLRKLLVFVLLYVVCCAEVHRNGFIGFITCSIFHMLFFLLLFKRVRNPFSTRVSQLPVVLCCVYINCMLYTFIFIPFMKKTPLKRGHFSLNRTFVGITFEWGFVRAPLSLYSGHF